MKPRKPMKRTFWKRKPRAKIKPVSDKRRKRAAAVAGLRRRLVNDSDGCMACGHSSRNPIPEMPPQMSKCHCHEIYDGTAGRNLSLDKPYAILVACWRCNSIEFKDAKKWPEARQLCLLMVRKPEDYNLKAYNTLVNPNAPRRILQSEVDAFLPTIPEL